jgi:hypothetical protein
MMVVLPQSRRVDTAAPIRTFSGRRGELVRTAGMIARTMSMGATMRGVQFLVDDAGEKTAVLIDLKKNAELWEDFYDLAIARSRGKESRETLESVRRRVTTATPRIK